MDHNIRCLDLCTSRVGILFGHGERRFACNCPCWLSLIKCSLSRPLTPHSSKRRFAPPGFGQDSRLRRIFLRFHPFIEFFVDVHNGWSWGSHHRGFPFYERIKESLSARRERSRASEHFIYESTAKLLGIFGVIQKSVNICTAVVKYRERKPRSGISTIQSRIMSSILLVSAL